MPWRSRIIQPLDMRMPILLVHVCAESSATSDKCTLGGPQNGRGQAGMHFQSALYRLYPHHHLHCCAPEGIVEAPCNEWDAVYQPEGVTMRAAPHSGGLEQPGECTMCQIVQKSMIHWGVTHCVKGVGEGRNRCHQPSDAFQCGQVLCGRRYGTGICCTRELKLLCKLSIRPSDKACCQQGLTTVHHLHQQQQLLLTTQACSIRPLPTRPPPKNQ
jgi:hypothetical protein